MTSGPEDPGAMLWVMVQSVLELVGVVATVPIFAAKSCSSSAVRVLISASRVVMRDWLGVVVWAKRIVGAARSNTPMNAARYFAGRIV